MPLPLACVTGAFGYSGQYIARHLLAEGHPVRTLTNSPARRHELAGSIDSRPFNFDRPAELVESLRGVDVLYNTYWVRFNHRDFKQADAVRNTIALFAAAQSAGVRRVVHVSITNPSKDSPLEYFSSKARLEDALVATGLSHAILRPAVLFGREDILINNIAWFLRRFPFFGLFGDGQYRMQPIYVDDLARLAVEQGSRSENAVINAIGPETFTYRDLVERIAAIIHRPARIVSVPPWLGLAIGNVVGKAVGDVVVTRAKIQGLMAGLLYVDAPAAGTTRLTDWAREDAATLGLHYASELGRRRDRQSAYPEN